MLPLKDAGTDPKKKNSEGGRKGPEIFGGDQRPITAMLRRPWKDVERV